jgi:hypothetical protein
MMAFNHAAGVSTATLQAELLDRAKGRHHQGGQADDYSGRDAITAPHP